jgi:hypothetical protein
MTVFGASTFRRQPLIAFRWGAARDIQHFTHPIQTAFLWPTILMARDLS